MAAIEIIKDFSANSSEKRTFVQVIPCNTSGTGKYYVDIILIEPHEFKTMGNKERGWQPGVKYPLLTSSGYVGEREILDMEIGDVIIDEDNDSRTLQRIM